MKKQIIATIAILITTTISVNAYYDNNDYRPHTLPGRTVDATGNVITDTGRAAGTVVTGAGEVTEGVLGGIGSIFTGKSREERRQEKENRRQQREQDRKDRAAKRNQ